MSKRTQVYIVLSTNQVRTYGTWETAIRVYERAKRMGVKGLEYMRSELKTGERFHNAPIANDWKVYK